MSKCVDFEDLKQCVDLAIAHGMTLAQFRVHMEDWTDFVEGYRWRNAREELPKVRPEKIYVDEESYYQESEDFLVWTSHDTDESGIVEDHAIARLCIDNGEDAYWMPLQQWVDSADVLAWMPLPEPYKEDE